MVVSARREVCTGNWFEDSVVIVSMGTFPMPILEFVTYSANIARDFFTMLVKA